MAYKMPRPKGELVHFIIMPYSPSAYVLTRVLAKAG